MINCPNNCGHAATIDPHYGVMLCAHCLKKDSIKPKTTIEFTSQAIKQQRKDYNSDIIQPYRKGELSKEYIDKYGAKRLGVSSEEIKKARNVWNGSDAGGYYNK